MRRPAISDTRAVHERTGWPSTSTVHAPHCPSPHPYFAPVRPSVSRSSQSSFESGWTSTVRGAPFTVSVTEGIFELYASQRRLDGVRAPELKLGPTYVPKGRSRTRDGDCPR